MWKPRLNGRPEVFQTISDTVTGHFGRGEVQIRFSLVRQENTDWNQGGRRFEIVIGGFDREARPSATRKRANGYRRFGIHRNSQYGRIGFGLGMVSGQLIKNCIRFGYLFWG